MCDGTLGGGVAVSELRLRLDRLFEVVIPVDQVSPELFDRTCRKCDITFSVRRVHADAAAAETFLLALEDNLPDNGEIKIGTDFDSPTDYRVIPNGYVTDYQLLQYIGASTLHQYHIVGGPPQTP